MRRAFTLIEILVVIVIIGVLATLVLSSIIPSKIKAEVGTVKVELERMAIVVNELISRGVEFPQGKDYGFKTQEQMDAKDKNKIEDSGNAAFFTLLGGKSKGLSGGGDIKFNLEESRYVPSIKDPKRKVFIDAFGNPFIYKCPGVKYENGFDLYSVGPNGLDEGGTGGDDILMKHPEG
jgi:prepilin-type N-terminal cleavage/methylation domain-containing protein